ncbi:uncharacterized protein METZ01_LOCUS166317, partial [marine metagenome]
MNSNTLDLIRSNDHRTISKVITNIENEKYISNSILDDVYAVGKKAIRLGITGPPGSGKSTLTDQLIQQILNDEKSVGIVAVDPTSPYTGGALLGDRVRMNNYDWNDSVFIRSMGSQGSLGGLATKAQIVGDVIAASGKDFIIFETVGVGQGEYDVIKAVDLTIVVLVPEAGDEIQLMKAGLIEVADLFVINKSDRDGADRLLKSLTTMLNTVFNNKDIIPSVFSTSADRSIGIEQLYNGIIEYLIMVKDKNLF